MTKEKNSWHNLFMHTHQFHHFMCFSLVLLLSSVWGGVAMADELPPSWAKLQLPFKESTIKRLRKGDTYAKASLSKTDKKGEKKFSFAAAGWHQRNCATALPRLAQYERYNHYLPFVAESTYQEASQIIDLVFKVWIIPFTLELRFKLPRISKVGSYPFVFEEGFLPDLHGAVNVQDVDDRCLILITANWQGPDPEINAFLFEMFAQTAGTIGMEKMLRATRD